MQVALSILPYDILSEILNYFKCIENAWTVYRFANDSFRSVYYRLTIGKGVDRVPIYAEYLNCYTNHHINPECLINIKTLKNIPISLRTDPNDFIHLKKLEYCHTVIYDINMLKYGLILTNLIKLYIKFNAIYTNQNIYKYINMFVNLEILEIGYIDVSHGEVSLSLPKLRSLVLCDRGKIPLDREYTSYTIINLFSCVALKKLYIGNMYLVKNIRMLINLEELTISKRTDRNIISECNLKRLKIISIHDISTILRDNMFIDLSGTYIHVCKQIPYLIHLKKIKLIITIDEYINWCPNRYFKFTDSLSYKGNHFVTLNIEYKY